MKVAELIDIALAGREDRRIEVAMVEPAEVAKSAVGGLIQLICEVADNALSFSGPDDRVRVTGLCHEGDYLITISDRGVGIPEPLLAELNRALGTPESMSGSSFGPGIAVIARLAARIGVDVGLVPGVPGTTARITVPGRLVNPAGTEPIATPPARRLPARPPTPRTTAAPEPVVGARVGEMSDEARRVAEDFLERVFSPLVQTRSATERPPHRAPPNGGGSGPRSGVARLRVRVPGQSFSVVEDGPSTMAAEGAIDIRSALSRYEQGRRAAEGDDDR